MCFLISLAMFRYLSMVLLSGNQYVFRLVHQMSPPLGNIYLLNELDNLSLPFIMFIVFVCFWLICFCFCTFTSIPKHVRYLNIRQRKCTEMFLSWNKIYMDYEKYCVMIHLFIIA